MNELIKLRQYISNRLLQYMSSENRVALNSQIEGLRYMLLVLTEYEEEEKCNCKDCNGGCK